MNDFVIRRIGVGNNEAVVKTIRAALMDEPTVANQRVLPNHRTL